MSKRPAYFYTSYSADEYVNAPANLVVFLIHQLPTYLVVQLQNDPESVDETDVIETNIPYPFILN